MKVGLVTPTQTILTTEPSRQNGAIIAATRKGASPLRIFFL